MRFSSRLSHTYFVRLSSLLFSSDSLASLVRTRSSCRLAICMTWKRSATRLALGRWEATPDANAGERSHVTVSIASASPPWALRSAAKGGHCGGVSPLAAEHGALSVEVDEGREVVVAPLPGRLVDADARDALEADLPLPSWQAC